METRADDNIGTLMVDPFALQASKRRAIWKAVPGLRGRSALELRTTFRKSS